jgi:hypothetical protein
MKKQMGWLALVGSVALILTAAPAAGAEDLYTGGASAKSQSGDVPVTSGLPSDVQESELPGETVTPVPAVVREALPTLSAAEVDTPVWRDGSLTLYVTGDVAALEAEAREAMVGVEVHVIESAHSRDEVDAAVRSLVAQSQASSSDGAFVAEAIPNEDGSRIDVGIAGPAAEELVADGAFDAASRGGIEIRSQVVDAPTPVTRNRTTPPVFSGQYMQNATAACTTGFWIGKATGERAIISADHCGGTPGENWYYGGGTDPSRIIGTAQGQAPGGTDLELFVTANPSLVNGYIFTGSATNSSSVSPIRGRYTADIIGDSVCYSGSRSGLVCQNTITSYAGSVCYSATMCYFNVTRTTQVAGQPAAGNGDSGGPVITVLLGGHVYASGIISGITNGTASCTGDPGGSGPNDRKCSAQVIYAPLEAFFNNSTGWGLMYIPQ